MAFWFVLQLVLGIITGVLIHELFEVLSGPEEVDASAFSLPFFGMVGVSSGFASYIGMSPLFVCVVAGVAFANISPHSERVYRGLARREHTLYVLFLLVAGCYWPFRGFSAWGWLALYIAIRALGKVLGSALSANTVLRSPELAGRNKIPWAWGIGLLPQGGLAIAMVVSYLWRFGNTAAAWAVTIVHVSVILNELVAPYFSFNLLRKADEA